MHPGHPLMSPTSASATGEDRGAGTNPAQREPGDNPQFISPPHWPQRSTTTNLNSSRYPQLDSQLVRHGVETNTQSAGDSAAQYSSSEMPDDSHPFDVPPTSRAGYLLHYSRSRDEPLSPGSSSSHSSLHSHDGDHYGGAIGPSEQHITRDATSSGDTTSATTNSGHSPPRPRRTRALMTRLQGDSLNQLWSQTMFPSTNEREILAQRIGLTARQVQVWFQNQRQKRRRERESDEAVAANVTIANTATAQTARQHGAYRHQQTETHWQRDHTPEGSPVVPRWPQRHAGPQVAATSSRYGQSLTLSSAPAASGPIPIFHSAYSATAGHQPRTSTSPETQAAGYRRSSVEDPSVGYFFDTHNRDQRDQYAWRAPEHSRHEQLQHPRLGKHSTWPYPGPPGSSSWSRESLESNRSGGRIPRPPHGGRSHTVDERESRRQAIASGLSVSPGQLASSAPDILVPTTGPRGTHLPPSLAGLVLDQTVDSTLDEAATLLSPILSTQSKELEPESPQRARHNPHQPTDAVRSSTDGAHQPKPPNLAQLLN